MPPKAKAQPKITFNTRLDPVVYNVLQERAVTEKVSQTELVDRALRAYLKLPAKHRVGGG